MRSLERKIILATLLLGTMLTVGAIIFIFSFHRINAENIDDVDLDSFESQYDFQSPEEEQEFEQQFLQDVQTSQNNNGNNNQDSNENNNENNNEDEDINKLQDIINSTQILSPASGTIVYNRYFTIKVQAKEAKMLEAYAKRIGSEQKNYLGKFSYQGNNIWELKLDADNNFPNGQYEVSIKIKNDYGEYKIGPFQLTIKHFLVSSDDSNGTDDWQYLNQDNLTNPTSSNKNSNNNQHSNNVSKEEVAKINPDSFSPYKKQLIKEGKADIDGDGLFNKEEIRRGTDPFNPDTDGDGFLDGDEVKNGYNPLKFSKGDGSDKIIFQDPREKGKVNKKFKIKRVKLVKKKENDNKPSQTKESHNQQKNLYLSGKALPNTFVNIYIYSQSPIIVTVKTDSQGNWSYELDKDIPDGEHEAYVVLNDNTGKITAKSEPFHFVKKAEAITIGSQNKTVPQVTSPIEESQTKSLIYLVAIIAMFSIFTLGLIGFTISHNKYSASKEIE